MEFVKSATAMRMAHKKSKLKMSFMDFEEYDIMWSALYEDAVQARGGPCTS